MNLVNNDSAYSITSPSDWPENFPELKDIDSALRCGICFEFFKTAMILPDCSHNFCSLCIRRYMNYKTRCPSCNLTVCEPSITNNRSLDNLTKSFISCRNKLLTLVKLHPPTDHQPTSPPINSSATPEARIATRDDQLHPSTSLSPQTWREPEEGQSSDTPTTPSTSRGSHVPSTSTPTTATATSSTEKVNCPICDVPVKTKYVNVHLDKCLLNFENRNNAPTRPAKRKHLPKLVYTLMKDRELKKKLSEYGLGTHGDRRTLIKRLQEFTLLYNSESDSPNPRSKSEIAKETEKNEKMQVKNLNSSLHFGKDQKPEETELVKQQYLKKHKSVFEALVNSVKTRRTGPIGETGGNSNTGSGSRTTGPIRETGDNSNTGSRDSGNNRTEPIRETGGNSNTDSRDSGSNRTGPIGKTGGNSNTRSRDSGSRRTGPIGETGDNSNPGSGDSGSNRTGPIGKTGGNSNTRSRDSGSRRTGPIGETGDNSNPGSGDSGVSRTGPIGETGDNSNPGSGDSGSNRTGPIGETGDNSNPGSGDSGGSECASDDHGRGELTGCGPDTTGSTRAGGGQSGGQIESTERTDYSRLKTATEQPQQDRPRSELEEAPMPETDHSIQGEPSSLATSQPPRSLLKRYNTRRRKRVDLTSPATRHAPHSATTSTSTSTSTHTQSKIRKMSNL